MSRAYRAAIAGLTVAGLVVLAGCAGKKVYGADTTTIETTVGRDIVIALESTPTTGYTWRVAGRVDQAIVGLISSDYEPSSSTALGAGGHQRWTFRVVDRGTTSAPPISPARIIHERPLRGVGLSWWALTA